MFTLDWWLSTFVTLLLGALFTAIIQGWLDKKKDQKRLVIQGMVALVFFLVMWVIYRSIVDEYGPLEWNRLRMVGSQFASGMSIFLALINLGSYLVVSIGTSVGLIKLEREKSVRTWVVIFVCLFIYVGAETTRDHLIAERGRIMGNVTEDLITDALILEQAPNKVFQ